MDAHSLTIALQSPASANFAACWVRLEQIIPSATQTEAQIADVYNLWLAAATGRSAQKLRPSSCPVEFDGQTVRAFLGFYIWPSNPALKYSLAAALGTISPKQAVNLRREFSVMFDNVDRFALPYYMQNVSCTWETPVFNEQGEQLLPRPTISLEDGVWLVLSEPAFGAVRVAGSAMGASVVLQMEIQKGLTTSNDITDQDIEEWRRGPNGEVIINAVPTEKLVAEIVRDLKNTIAVAYSCPTGGLGFDEIESDDIENTTLTTEQTDVTIPGCLEDLLSFCPDPFLGVDDNTTLWCDEIKTEKVYYNACTGAILGSRESEDGQSYCSRVASPSASPTAAPAWLPTGWQR